MKRWWQSLKEFLSESVSELKKVSFPRRSETVGSTVVVLVFVVIVSVFLAVIDHFLAGMVRVVIR